MDSKIQYKHLNYLSEEDNGKVVVYIEVKGLVKKNKNEAKNAVIDKEFGDRTLTITIDGTKEKLENKHFRLNIKQLPGEIKADACTLKVENQIIEVHLIKADKDESWDLKNGLETFKEEIANDA